MMEAPRFKSLQHDKITSEILFRLITMDGKGNIYSFGTAFALHPYLLVTAKHVIDQFAAKHGGAWSGNAIELTFWAVQIQWIDDKYQYNVWIVTCAFSSTDSDIALLKISPLNKEAHEYKDWKILRANLELPKVNEEIIAFGFHEMTFEGSKITDEGLFEHIEMNAKVSAAHGTILEVYPSKRDSVMLPFPVARVNARFEPGMSGGPVINSRSELCGVICSSIKIDDEYESFVSLLWSMVGIPVNFDLYDKSPVKGYQPLYVLIKAGIWFPKGAAHVTVVKRATENQFLVEYV